MKQISVVISVLLAGASAHAQDKAAEIDRIFSWTRPTDPGCAVAVSHQGKEVVNRAYGVADLERNVPLTGASVFDVGSIRKQFVAASILLLASEGRLSLSDDVRKHVPELHDYGTRITLDHLLTHTSGLRDWTGLLNLADGDMDAWTMILRQRGLNFTPGEEWSYSNTNYVLLTEIVARVGGMPFSEFARKRLFEPLGMKATRYVNDMREIIKDRALAYEKEGGGFKQDMLLGNDRGGGGALFSTASDLLIWSEALASDKLGASLGEKLSEPGKLNNGRTIHSAGRGLFMETYRGARVIWYTGSSAAYKGYLGRFPEHGLAISILCNSGDNANRKLYAQKIFDQFVPTAGPLAETETGPPPANSGEALADVNAKAGLFFSERAGEPLRLAVDRGRFRVAGGPGLAPVAKDRYRRWGVTAQYMSEDNFELIFVSQDEFDLKSMEGKKTRYRRAVPFAPTEADLAAFAGRYQSDEMKAVIHMAVVKGALMGRINEARGDGSEFKPVHLDTFQFGPLTLRFQRDKAGKVVGLDFRSPALANIRFNRLADFASRQ